MYVKDEAADAVVAADEKIQAALQGRSVMLLVPGHMAGVAVNACLMIGWLGTLIGAFHLFPFLRDSVGWYLIAIAIFSVSLATFWTVILRGHRPGRALMHGFAITSLAIATGMLCLALARSDRVGVGLAGSGLAFMLTAQRIIAGARYAQFTAFFRAKRTYELVTALKR
ncbi:MAG TPA: hypothetical protein VJR89_34065 [Polyangiales bacterium]|nr:hypothetical protein [Polyangiales bacterium]